MSLKPISVYLLISSLCLLPQITFAQEGMLAKARVTVRELSLVKAPLQVDQKLCTVNNGAELPIIQRSTKGNWYEVDPSHISGCEGVKRAWVYGEPFVEIIGNTAPGYVVTAPNSGVNVRTKPTVDSKIICKIQNAERVNLIGPYDEDAKWIEVNLSDVKGCKGETGFVHSNFIKEIETIIKNETDFDDTSNATDPGLTDFMGPVKTEASICESCDKAQEYKSIKEMPNQVLNEMIEAYSRSDEVQKMLSALDKIKYGSSQSDCYLNVKMGLCHITDKSMRGEGKSKLSKRHKACAANKGGLVDNYLPGNPAIKAHAYGKSPGDLKKAGFMNLLENPEWAKKIKSPYDAPNGAILVYSGGNTHIEVKTNYAGKNGFISDFYSESARTGGVKAGLVGRGRRLVGVYFKPGVQ